MSLDIVRTAKEKGWRVILFSIPPTPDSEGSDDTAFALLTPGGEAARVSEREGYGSIWGDATEPEAWQRLPSDI